VRRALGIAVAAVLLAAGTVIAAPAPADTLDHRSDLLGHNRLPGSATPSEPSPDEDAPATEPGIEDLRNRHLVMPVEGVDPADLNDGFLSRRGRRFHHGIDIMAPRETPIHAVDDGVIARLDARSRAGGITVYQIDATGTYGYYYAHLERWAEGLAVGDAVTRGQTIGYVGSTGNAPERSPHLHFAIHRLGPSRQPWVGSPLNPYLVFLP
jgi:murein DD-endopeptidase MepM/ murein hydrolase activator NlpD